MYTIKTTDNIIFTVNNNHRLAVRCHFEPQLIKSFDDASDKDIYWVYHHEISEDGPIEIENKFFTEHEAMFYILELENNPKAIQYGEVVPVSVNRLTLPNEETHEKVQKVMKYYKLFKYDNEMKDDTDFEIIDAGHGEYFGFELDGDKKYVMQNGYVTYNSNGKSTTTELIQNMMGDYASMLPNTVLTRKSGGSGNAVPELADKRGKRFLILQEPEASDTLQIGKMKELTAGNDKIYARALYGDPFTYRPQFKLVLTCNALPHIPNVDDGGFKRRTRVLPWTSIFKKDPVGPNEFKADPTLSEKMKKWGAPFAWYILNEWYPKYIKDGENGDGLREPDKVKIATDQYNKDSDFYMEFLDEYIEKVEDSTETVDYIYALFKSWYKEAYDTHPKPKKELIKYMTNNKYSINKGMVKGVKVILPEDRND
jgi:P4 family phage/plasmid primase-like protien